MFLVGGGILTHGIAPLHHAIERLTQSLGGWAALVLPLLADAVVGLLAGALVLLLVQAAKRLRK